MGCKMRMLVGRYFLFSSHEAWSTKKNLFWMNLMHFFQTLDGKEGFYGGRIITPATPNTHT